MIITNAKVLKTGLMAIVIAGLFAGSYAPFASMWLSAPVAQAQQVDSNFVHCSFSRPLGQGSVGEDIRCLQRYLNNAGFVLTTSGVGSFGNETSFYGPLTANAVARWQNFHRAEVLVPLGLGTGTGFWGTFSINHYNQLKANAGDDGVGGFPGDNGDFVLCSFSRPLGQGSVGEDVRCLQLYLNNGGFVLATSGVGSPGNETSFYGPLTANAVARWQNFHRAEVLAPLGLSAGTGFWGTFSINHYNNLRADAEDDDGTGGDPGDDDDDDDNDNGGGDQLGWDFINRQDPNRRINVPRGAQGVTVFNVRIIAEEDGTLDSLTLKRVGVGSDADFDGFYLFSGDARISNERSMRSDTDEVSFNNIGLSLEDGQSVELMVVANLSTSAGTNNVDQLEVVDVQVSGITDENELIGMRGFEHSISGVTVGSLEFDDSGSLTDPAIGEQNAKLARFRIDNVQGEDISIDRIALEQDGSVDLSALNNLELVDSSNNLVATGKIMSTRAGDLVVLTFTNTFNLDQGQSAIFTLQGDIESGADVGDTIQFRLEESVDLMARGENFGFNVMVNDGGAGLVDLSTNFPSTLQLLTIEGGRVTVSFNKTPGTGSVLTGGNNVPLLNFSITAESTVNLESFPVRFEELTDGGGTANADNTGLIGTTGANLRDLRIINSTTGQTLMGPEELSVSGSDTAQTIVFDDTFTINSGQTLNMSVVADINNSTPNNQGFRATLLLSSTQLVVEDINGDDISDEVVPQTDIQGNTQTAVSSALSVSLAADPSSANVISGGDDFRAIGFRFTAGTGSSVTISDITLQAYSDGNTTGSLSSTGSGTGDGDTSPQALITSVKLVNESNQQIGSLEAVQSDGSVVFDNVSLTIPAGSTRTVFALVDVANNAPFGSSPDRFSFDIENASDVIAENNQGNIVTLASAMPNNGINPIVVHTIQTGGGALSISVAADNPESKIIIAGEQKALFLSTRFQSTFENFEIQKMLIEADVAGTADEFGTIYVIDENSNVVAQGTLNVNGELLLSNETGGLFTVDQDTTVRIAADVAPHSLTSSAGSDSGDRPRLRLTVADTSATGEIFKAVGTQSGNTLSASTSLPSDLVVNENMSTPGADVIVGNRMLVRRANPFLTVNTLSNTLSSGSNRELVNFNVSSETGGDTVSVKSFTFETTISDSGVDNANNLTLSNFRWFEGGVDKTTNVSINLADSANFDGVAGEDISAGSGNAVSPGDNSSNTVKVVTTYNNGQELLVNPGASQIVSLRADITNADQGDDAVTVTLLEDLNFLVNNFHDFFTGDLDVDSDIYTINDGNATDAVVFYDINGNAIFNDGVDVVLGSVGNTANLNGIPGVLADVEVLDDGTNIVLFADLGTDTTAIALDIADIQLGSNTTAGVVTTAVDAMLARAATGSNFTIYWENTIVPTSPAQFDSSAGEDVEAGSSPSTIANNKQLFGNVHFVWSDESTIFHSTNTADWMNGFLVNRPQSTLSDITHTKQ